MPENRLEKKRATVQEQKAKQEQLARKKLQKKKYVNVMQPIPKVSQPTNLTLVLGIIVALVLGVGFSGMLVSTFSFEVNYPLLIIFIGLWSWACAAAWMSEETSRPYVLATVAVLISAAMLFFDIFKARTQAEYFYMIIQQKAWRGLPVVFKNLEKRKGEITYFILIANIIPAYLTTFTIIKRKHVIIAAIPYLPFLLTSTIITYITPAALACEIAVAGVLLLICFQFVRRIGDSSADERMLKIVVPVIIFALLAGNAFPKKGYTRNKTALSGATKIESMLKKLGAKINTGDPDPNPTPAPPEKKREGYMGSVVMEDGQAYVRITTEDLSKVGMFDPPDIKVADVYRYYNEPIADMVPISGHHMYLKTASMEVFEGNSWSMLHPEDQPADYYYESDSESYSRNSDFIVEVKPVLGSDVFLVPNYIDHYFVNEESVYSNLNITKRTTWNLNESTLNPSGVSSYYYAYNDVPQQLDVMWNQEYLDEIYSTCLYVPEETRTSILESEVLPEWYMQLLDGTITMTDEEKVMAVVSYVRTVHPYRHATPYPPEDVDFVTWFLTDSECGFCVHYATTTAVLLRMVGVPTRYVTGYLFVSEANHSRSEVSMVNAHAWIEFFNPEYGWILDDPTPGNGVAASYFNIYAVAQEYGIEFENKIPATPTPTPSHIGKITPTPEVKKEKKTIKPSDIFLHPAMIVLYILIAIVLLFRLIFYIYWIVRFRRGDTASRANAYDEYFSMHCRILKGATSRVGRSILKKADYSEKGIQDDDLKKMIRFGKHNLQVQRRNRHFIRKILSGFLLRVNKM